MLQTGLLGRLEQQHQARSLLIVCGAGTSLHASEDPRAGWWGFLDHAIEWCEAGNISLGGGDGIDRARGDLQAGDLISVADKVQRGLEEAGDWTRFLLETVGALAVVDPSVPRLLGRLRAPIAVSYTHLTLPTTPYV